MISSFSIRTVLTSTEDRKCEATVAVWRVVERDDVPISGWIQDCLLDLSTGFLESIIQDVVCFGEIPHRLMLDCGGENKFTVVLVPQPAKRSRSRPESVTLSLRITVANDAEESIEPGNFSKWGLIPTTAKSLWTYLHLAVNSGSKTRDLCVVLMPQLVDDSEIEAEDDLADQFIRLTICSDTGEIVGCTG